MTRPFADYDEAPIAWREAGSGSPVIFLHGLGGTRESWGPQLRVLAEDFRCIAWDMPGYGGSAMVQPLDYATIADRLVGLMDRLEIEEADLVGLSFGGMHALHTALRYPARVRRLVLADTSPAFGMDGTDPVEWKRARLSAIEAGETPASIAATVLDAIAGRPLDAAVRSQLIAAMARISSAGFAAAVECLPHNDIRDSLGDIAHQSLVIVGELDTETPPAYAQVLADGLANASLVVMAGVGHLSPSEDPAAFNQLVKNWLC